MDAAGVVWPGGWFTTGVRMDAQVAQVDVASATSEIRALRRSAPVRRYQPLVIVALAVCAGIVADRYQPLPIGGWWLAAGGGLVLWWLTWRRQWRGWSTALLLLAAAAAGGAWHHGQWRLFSADDVGNFARPDAQPICVEVIAAEAPRRLPALLSDPARPAEDQPRWRLHVELCAVRDDDAWRAASGVALLNVQGTLDDIRAGDRLRLFAKLLLPATAQNPGQFDYRNYLRADRCRALLRVAHPEGITVVQRPRFWSLRRGIDAVRSYGLGLLNKLFDRDQSGLLAAVVLGAREQLDPDLTAAFMETGTIHLMVVSGLNVATLALAAGFVLRRIWRRRAAVLATVAALAVFYMVLTDAQPPVVRATVLVLGGALALAYGRTAAAFNTLAAAALVVLIVNPTDLFNVGAQLSFLCVAGLAGLSLWHAGRQPAERDLPAVGSSPIWEMAKQVGVRGGRALGGFLVVSTVIWALVAPLVMSRFHLFTPVAPLVNAIVVVPVNVAMVGGFALLALGWVPGLGSLLAGACSLSLYAMETCIAWGRQVPLGHRWVGGPADWWLVGFYGGLGVMLAVPALRPPWRWRWALLALWVAVGFAAGRGGDRRQDLACTVLSVAHGCAVVLELPSGETFLCDAGQLGAPQAAANTIAGYLWSRGITRLDGVFLSHADSDHYNALPDLLQRFSVGTVFVSPVMFEQRSRSLLALHAALDRAGVQVKTLEAGDRFARGASLIEVLHPPPRGVVGSHNANSLVLRVSHAGQAVLLPGDLDSPGLEDLLAEEPRACRVLLAPHHGSRRSRPNGLIGWCQPDWIIISGARNRDFAEIVAYFRQTGVRALHTAACGAVRFDLGGSAVTPQGYFHEPSAAADFEAGSDSEETALETRETTPG